MHILYPYIVALQATTPAHHLYGVTIAIHIYSYRPSTPLTHSGDDDNWYINNRSRLFVLFHLLYLYKSQLFGKRNVYNHNNIGAYIRLLLYYIRDDDDISFLSRVFLLSSSNDAVRSTSPFHRYNLLLYSLL